MSGPEGRLSPSHIHAVVHFVGGMSSAFANRLKKLKMQITDVISTICAGDQWRSRAAYASGGTLPGVGVIASAYANALRHASSNASYDARATDSSCSVVAPSRPARAVCDASQ